jgi:hypothetical protein
MQNFINENWIAFWRAFNGFVQLLSAVEIFTCCTIMRQTTKLLVFANLWNPKMLQPFITPIFSTFISARLFSVHHIENEVERSPLCRDPTSRNWWIKEGPKSRIFGSFSENVRLRKSSYMPMKFILNNKRFVSSWMCLRFFQKISLNPFGPHCVFHSN